MKKMSIIFLVFVCIFVKAQTKGKLLSLIKNLQKRMDVLEKENKNLKREVECLKEDIMLFSGFRYLRSKTYVCGSIRKTVREYIHIKTGMEFVFIPGGSIKIQRAPEGGGPYEMVEFTLSPYLISKTEVTQRVWKNIMPEYNFYGRQEDNLPMGDVSWRACQRFCRKAGVKLPTEAQWEYACRGGSAGKYCYGDSVRKLKEYAWYSKNCKKSQPVAKKKPNAYGLYDMHGNVSEWCSDLFMNSECIHRGGSYYNGASEVRSTSCESASPKSRFVSRGFRLVYTP